MSHSPFRLGAVAALLVAAAPALIAQTQTGALVVTVKDPSGRPLPGVRVELRSDRLQGTRSGRTDEKGAFRAPLLPPGDYRGTLTMDGYRGASLSASVPLGGTSTAEIVLKPMEVQGAVVAVVGTASKLDKTEVSVKENFRQDDILLLPVQRNLAGITALAPGVTLGAGDRVVVAGAATYENKFLVNGVDVNDNLFNSDVGLFIEDAIEETQVVSNNVSAEYGRFTGGVINAITRRGGNTFSGSYRATMTNSAWNAVLPLQSREDIVDKVNTIHVFTFGGPIIKDRLWFFTAGRSTSVSTTNPLPGSGVNSTREQDETRYEVNLTWQVNADHRIGASYLSREVKDANRPPLVDNTADPNGLYNRRDPMSLKSLTYDAILTPTWNLNITLAEKLQKITTGNAPGNGGTAFWQSPVFDADGFVWANHYFGNDPEERNNQSFKVTLANYFEAGGSHALKYGYELFKEINSGTNRQSTTGYVIDASATTYATGAAYSGVTFDFDANSYLEDWTISPGGKFTSTYHSAFINDDWTLNPNWNFSLGVRFESFIGNTTDGYETPSFQDVVPRLGVNYDPRGDGVWQLSASYAQYAGKANQTIVTLGTYVGNPAVSYYWYAGAPAAGVVPGPSNPGFRRSDYDAVPFLVLDPTKTTVLDPDLKAPLTHEYDLGLKHKVSEDTNFTLLYTYRSMTRMFEDYVGHEGTVNLEGVDYSIVRWGNAGADARRTYRALQGTFATAFDLLGGRLNLQGNATFSQLTGNYDGDGGNQPGGGTPIGDYPLVRTGAVADGRLPNDEPVRIKIFGTWRRPIGPNTLTLSANFDMASGKPYSFTANQLTSDPTGIYADADGNPYTRFYGGRGTGRFNDTYLLDMGLQWDGALGSSHPFGYFVKVTAFNVLNWIQQAQWDTRGVNYVDPWTARPTFGQATLPQHYVGNRRIQLDLGFRF